MIKEHSPQRHREHGETQRKEILRIRARALPQMHRLNEKNLIRIRTKSR
jgi:hypothetical protein